MGGECGPTETARFCSIFVGDVVSDVRGSCRDTFVGLVAATTVMSALD